MTYIDLINRFWEAYRVKKFSDIDTTIYFFLLDECNIRRWLNPFELQTRNIEICIGVSRKTIGDARKRLKKRGLIDFIEAQGRGPTTYLIDGADITNNVLRELFCASNSVTSKKHKGNTRVTQGLHKGNTTQDSTLYIEDIRYKNKESSVASATSSAPQRASEPIEKSLFADEEKKAANRKSPPRAKPSFTPPTLDDVKEYFLSHDADKRLENWEECAQRFYDYFNAVDWIDKNGRRITRWDSRANSWIIDDEKREKEKEQKQSKHNEQNTFYRRTTPDDTLAVEQEKLAKRIFARRIGQTAPGSAEGDSDLPFG